MKKKKLFKEEMIKLEQSGEFEIYYQDECHFKHCTTMTRGWFLKGKTPEIKDAGSYEKLSVFGAYNKDLGRMIITTSTYFNAKSFKQFLQHMLKRVKLKSKKILLVLDNARYHKAKELQEFIKTTEDKLVLKFLPPYSPDLNPIETQWRETRRNATHNRYFANFEDQRAAIINYWHSKPGNKKKDIYTANI